MLGVELLSFQLTGSLLVGQVRRVAQGPSELVSEDQRPSGTGQGVEELQVELLQIGLGSCPVNLVPVQYRLQGVQLPDWHRLLLPSGQETTQGGAQVADADCLQS